MRNGIYLTGLFMLVLSCGGPAETPESAEAAAPEMTETEAMIAEALSAAPAPVAAGATVMDWDNNVLKEGSNGWVCMPTAPALTGTAPMCLDEQWQKWAAAWNSRTEPEITAVGIAYMLQGDAGASNTDPYAEAETPDNEWVVTGPHVMIIVPDPAMLAGIPTDPSGGGPYVMWRDTPYVHVMMPIE